MAELRHSLRTRIPPAILTAAGVTLVVAGLLTWTKPAEAQPRATPAPTPVAVVPSVSPTSSATASATVPPGRLPTRVQIAALQIDLPVIKQPDPSYPSCNVAMYHELFGPPGDSRGTYIYAHARKGMFLALLDASKQKDGVALLGMIVNVYTSDDQLFLYEISEVRRHVPATFNLAKLLPQGKDTLWLQTSEGPSHIYPKLILKAKLLSSGPADHAAAHPVPKPITCG
jgi:hypothetical protein